MSHPKTRLPLGLAATLSAAAAVSSAFAAPPPPGADLLGPATPVSHNEQGNLRVVPGDDAVIKRATHAPPPCPADQNGDGAVTSADISAFIATWMMSVAAGTLEGDFDQNGVTTSADISAFLSVWVNASALGC